MQESRYTGNKRETGTYYEAAAARALEREGYLIIARNYRCRTGEIDLIARDRDTLVFAEVKYRRNAAAGYPEEAVGAAKQRVIRKTAAWFMSREIGREDILCRFDVVAVIGEQGHETVRIIRDAF